VELQAGFELEWLVASHRPDADPHPAMPGGPYGADRLVEGLDYATALLDALEAAGIPWLQFHPEYGAGQFELSLAAGTPLEAADRLVHARLVIQRVTRRFGGHFGWHCSFSPKPSLERVGNGGHLHLSVQRDGVPLLVGGAGPGGLSDAGGAVLAALLAELPALLALACPLEISYRRLAPGSWSAPFQVWGIENREAALRLIPTAADGAAAHLELKVVDLAANPYLLLAAVQAVALAGLEKERPLPPPVAGDPALLPAGAAVRLPSSLAEASAAFAASALLRRAFGEELHASLIDSQAAEVRRCAGISDVELVAADAWWPLVGGVG
jgi:glutamine synthetase